MLRSAPSTRRRAAHARPSTRRRASAAALLGTATFAAAVWVAGPTVATGATTPSSPTTPTSPANPTPPQLTTGGTEGVSLTGATLTASVNPGGAETTYRFEYGTSTSYGLKTADATVPAGTSAVTVKAPISGLTQATQYHYRVVGTNAAGSVQGGDKTFTTASSPKRPSVATRAPSPVGANDATLLGRVNPQGQDTTVRFEWGTSTKYGKTTPAQSAGNGTTTITVPAAITGLKANTKYYFRTVATNKTGTSRSTARSFTTGRGLSGLIINLSSPTIAWDGTITIGGTLGGQSPGGVTVTLLRQDHPFTAPFREIASAKTSSSGAYGFSLKGVYANAKLQVIVKNTTAASPVVDLGSEVLAKLRVTKRKAKSVRLSGTVLPANLPSAARVSIQKQTPKGRWVRVGSRHALTVSKAGKLRFAVTVRRISRSVNYRALIIPNDGGAHVQTASATVVVPKRR